MRPSISSALLITLFLLCFIHGATSQENLIRDSCRTFAKDDPNINFNFCTTSLQAAPASHCAALRGLGTISFRLIRYNVTDTRCMIRQLLKGKKLDPYVRQCLNDCFELYSDAIDTMKQAMKAYNTKRFADANIEISSIMDAATTCEDGFNERKGVLSPLTKRNNNTFELSAIALNVMRILQTRSD
ncbi:putative invertase inhibitor [Coffea arabica]|uniref:Invertase inhibitor n=2 Tax=Coffea TaxID=13442 RepID=A7IZL0_COFCA|nr:putative invertase inhibitor [Coffea arabica]XP_027106629.1 putative invertase inhibitor [Coffea arabica]ABI17896.1 invertase inhibitor [Coffea canephora]